MTKQRSMGPYFSVSVVFLCSFNIFSRDGERANAKPVGESGFEGKTAGGRESIQSIETSALKRIRLKGAALTSSLIASFKTFNE